jgi:tetratricopeptide (TPR) repeat protein
VSADVERARALSTIGRGPEAIQILHQALSVDPHNYSLLMELAMIQLDHDCADSLRATEWALKVEPDAEHPHRVRAIALQRMSKRPSKAALQEARIAVQKRPDLLEAHVALAEQLSYHRKKSEALKEANYAISLRPDSSLGYSVLGAVYMRQNKPKLAEAPLRHALSIDPMSVTAKQNLAATLGALQRSGEAMAITQSLILEKPSESANVDQLIADTHAYLREGPINQAVSQMMRLAFLRITILIALALLPFAWFERRSRRATLPVGTWAAVQRAKKSQEYKRRKRKREQVGLKILITVVGAVVIGIIIFSM